MEAAVSDFKRIAEEHSVKSTLLTLAYEDNAKLTAELDALKAKYNDADFNFKKFDVSSNVVETMIEKQLRFKNEHKTKAGLGYNAVPPPFNDNYTPPLEHSEFEPFEYVGKPLTTDSVVIDKSNESDSKPAEATNVTDSCAGKQEKKKEEKKVVKEVEAEKEKKEEKKKEKKEKKKQDDIGSSSTANLKTTDLVSDESKTPENHNIKLTVLVEPVVKCCCSCECINAEKTTPTSTKSTSSGPEPSQEPPALKQKNCFHCGSPGHLAKNCPNRSHVSVNAQIWQHVPRGQYSKRSHSTSRSDGDWIADKAKRQRPVDNREQTPDPKDAFTKPFWFRSTSSDGSRSSSHLRHKPKVKGVRNSKSSVAATIQQVKNYVKPDYRWVLKRQTSTATVKGEYKSFG